MTLASGPANVTTHAAAAAHQLQGRLSLNFKPSVWFHRSHGWGSHAINH